MNAEKNDSDDSTSKGTNTSLSIYLGMSYSLKSGEMILGKLEKLPKHSSLHRVFEKTSLRTILSKQV